MSAGEGVRLYGYSHPGAERLAGSGEDTLLGKYGALVALKQSSSGAEPDLSVVKQLCLQVIGPYKSSATLTRSTFGVTDFGFVFGCLVLSRM